MNPVSKSDRLSKFDREYLNDDVDSKILIASMYIKVFGNGYVPPHPRRKFRLKQFYNNHFHNAKVRGIDWLLTFSQWLTIWADSGQLCKRGRKVGEFMMCRINEPGPYSVENVYIGTPKDNAADRIRNTAKAISI